MDRSKKTKAELAALQATELRLRALTEATSDWLWEVDQNAVYTYTSLKVADLLGYGPAEVIGKTPFDFMPPDEAKRVAGLFKDISSSREPFAQLENTYLHKDGRRVVLETSGVPILDAEGNLHGYRGIDRDITDRKQADKTLKEKEHLNQLLLDTLPHPVMLLRKDRVILAANRVAREAGAKVGGYCWRDFGKSESISDKDKEYIKKHKRVPPGGTHCHFCLADEALANQKPARSPETHAWGSIWDIYWIPLDDEVYLHYAINIAERKQAEQEREKLLQDMEERVKELTCMYGVARSIRQRQTIQEIFSEVVALIPPSWQYPEITRAKVRFEGRQYVSEPFEETKWKQTSDIAVAGEVIGSVEVYYLQQRPDLDGPPFLSEEHRLIDGIASALSEAIEHRRADQRVLRQAALLDGINTLFREMLICETEQDVANTCLDVAQQLTHSKLGFLGELNQDETFSTKALSNAGWDACRMPKSDAFALLQNMEFGWILGRVLKEGKPQIVNAPAIHPESVGVPKGHPPLTSFLGVPMAHRGKVFGMIAVANKETGYEPSDQQDLEALSVAFVEALMRKRSEEELRTSQRQLAIFKRFTEESKQGLGMADLDGTVVYVNHTLSVDLLEHEKLEDMLGASVTDYYPPELKKRITHEILPQVLKEGQWVGELPFVSVKGKTAPTLQSVFLVRDDKGKPLYFANVIADITKRKQAEEALKEAHDKLEARVQERTAQLAAANRQLRREIDERLRAEEQARIQQAELAHLLRVSTMGEMASGLAHEISQPLSAVAAYAEACKHKLKSAASSSEETGRLMDEIIQEVFRAGEIIRRIRGFVRKQEFQKCSMNLNDSVREVVKLVAQEAQRTSVTVGMQLDEALPLIVADDIQIRQVLVNLLRNAIEAMSDMVSGPRELTVRTSLAQDNHAEIIISDTGPGIPRDIIDQLFQPFETTKSEGLGMGLPISRSIIEAHGGRLWATPNPDRGMAFGFILPLEQDTD